MRKNAKKQLEMMNPLRQRKFTTFYSCLQRVDLKEFMTLCWLPEKEKGFTYSDF